MLSFNSHRFDTPVRRCLLSSQPNIHLQAARLTNQSARSGTFRIRLPAPCRKITSYLFEPSMTTYLIAAAIALAVLMICSKLPVLKSLSKARCRFCDRPFGWVAAFRNKIVFRVVSISWDESTPLFARNIDFMHVRQVCCRHCRTLSTIDARGIDGSDMLEFGEDNHADWPASQHIDRK